MSIGKRSILPPAVPTADVCDQIEGAAVIMLPFQNYGGKVDFSGPALCLKTNHDNSVVKAHLTSPGHGRVLVIDNGGQMDKAMVGGNLAKWGAENGWVGIIVHGAVRDCHELSEEPIGIKALGACPRKTEKGTAETLEQPVTLGGVCLKNGQWITADLDGVVVTDEKPSL